MHVQRHFLLWAVGLAQPQTFYTAPECATLGRYAAGRRRLVEIGCWHGVNTARLRHAMASDGVLFAVDPYPPGALGFNPQRIIARREVSKAANGTVQWLRLTDVEAAALFGATGEPPVDFLFSDSLNTYEGFQACWEAWSPLLAPGGIYILANSRPTPEKPIEGTGAVRFTREVVLRDRRFKQLEVVGCFTVLQRR